MSPGENLSSAALDRRIQTSPDTTTRLDPQKCAPSPLLRVSKWNLFPFSSNTGFRGIAATSSSCYSPRVRGPDPFGLTRPASPHGYSYRCCDECFYQLQTR